mmetsp:Transcript_43731/g.121002  ORF Transcript_43731/g.121002 Transcript_43731/m.121002 type:complete len:212 (+) Transcript_43731:530-1165(+)
MALNVGAIMRHGPQPFEKKSTTTGTPVWSRCSARSDSNSPCVRASTTAPDSSAFSPSLAFIAGSALPPPPAPDPKSQYAAIASMMTVDQLRPNGSPLSPSSAAGAAALAAFGAAAAAGAGAGFQSRVHAPLSDAIAVSLVSSRSVVQPGKVYVLKRGLSSVAMSSSARCVSGMSSSQRFLKSACISLRAARTSDSSCAARSHCCPAGFEGR